jgi:hypothetical protein
MFIQTLQYHISIITQKITVVHMVQGKMKMIILFRKTKIPQRRLR